MTYLNQTIEEWLSGKVNIVRFVDISALDFRQNRGMPCAVLLGIAMSPKFIDSVDACMDEDEYVRIEH